MTISVIHQFQLAVPSTELTVAAVKLMVHNRVGIAPARQSLFFDGDELTGDGTLAQFGVQLDSTLILTVGDPLPSGDEVSEDDEDDEEGIAGGNGTGYYHHQPHPYGFNYPHYMHCHGNQTFLGYNFPAYNYPAYNHMQWNAPIVNYWAQSENAQYEDDSAANQNEPEMLPVKIGLHIMRPGSSDILTVIDMLLTDTVYKLKVQIQRILGHDLWSQRLDDGENPLDDQAMIQDIPKLLESQVVYLSILSAYRFHGDWKTSSLDDQALIQDIHSCLIH